MILSTEIMNSFKCKKNTLHLNFKRVSTDIYQLYVDETSNNTCVAGTSLHSSVHKLTGLVEHRKHLIGMMLLQRNRKVVAVCFSQWTTLCAQNKMFVRKAPAFFVIVGWRMKILVTTIGLLLYWSSTDIP